MTTDPPTGPPCGNNPNHPLTDSDRAAIAEFRSFLTARAAQAELDRQTRAGRFALAWRSARRRAREHTSEEQRLRGWVGYWHRRARAAEEQLAERPAPTGRDRLAALLAHHTDLLAAHLRTNPARDRWIAAEQLDTHALALTADEETPAVRQLLDDILAFDAEHPTTAPPAPADREHIAQALTAAAHDCDGDCGLTEADCRAAHPIVVSATVGDTVHIDGPVEAIADAVLAVLPSPADRVAVLREAADELFARCPALGRDDALPKCPCVAAKELRRMADEAQQTRDYETTTGHTATCGNGFDRGCQCGAEAQQAEPAPHELASMFEGFARLLATSSRDWQPYRVDAWLYAVLVGWDCEQATHDESCTHGAMEETAAMHGWDADTVAKARRYRTAVRAITEGQQP